MQRQSEHSLNFSHHIYAAQFVAGSSQGCIYQYTLAYVCLRQAKAVDAAETQQQLDSTRLDSTQLNSTHLTSPHLSSAQLNPTQPNSTEKHQLLQ